MSIDVFLKNKNWFISSFVTFILFMLAVRLAKIMLSQNLFSVCILRLFSYYDTFFNQVCWVVVFYSHWV